MPNADLSNELLTASTQLKAAQKRAGDAKIAADRAQRAEQNASARLKAVIGQREVLQTCLAHWNFRQQHLSELKERSPDLMANQQEAEEAAASWASEKAELEQKLSSIDKEVKEQVDKLRATIPALVVPHPDGAHLQNIIAAVMAMEQMMESTLAVLRQTTVDAEETADMAASTLQAAELHHREVSERKTCSLSLSLSIELTACFSSPVRSFFSRVQG